MKYVLRHCRRGASRCLARESTCTAGDPQNFRLGGPTPRRSVTMGYEGALLPHAMTLLLDDPACIYDIRVIAEDCYWLPKNDALFVQAVLPVFRTPQRSGLGHGRDTRHVGGFGEPKKIGRSGALRERKSHPLLDQKPWKTSSDRGIVESRPTPSYEASTRKRTNLWLPSCTKFCI